MMNSELVLVSHPHAKIIKRHYSKVKQKTISDHANVFYLAWSQIQEFYGKLKARTLNVFLIF